MRHIVKSACQYSSWRWRNLSLCFIEGPEWVKWELGIEICLFLAGKMGFHAVEMEFMSNQTIESGNAIKI
jgi:hypothetical protein